MIHYFTVNICSCWISLIKHSGHSSSLMCSSLGGWFVFWNLELSIFFFPFPLHIHSDLSIARKVGGMDWGCWKRWQTVWGHCFMGLHADSNINFLLELGGHFFFSKPSMLHMRKISQYTGMCTRVYLYALRDHFSLMLTLIQLYPLLIVSPFGK